MEQVADGKPDIFFMGRSPCKGGPLGAGAAIVELDPEYLQEGNKKYIISLSDVEEGRPVGKKTFLFRTDKVRRIVDFIVARQQQY